MSGVNSVKRNIKLVIMYDGTKYSGWQRLKNSEMTIQGKIETVLSKMTGEDIQLIGSGRTDAGVHAFNQIANFHTTTLKKVKDIKAYLNQYLPKDIVIKDVKEASERFHSRYNVKEKTYLYRIWTTDYPPVFEEPYTIHMHQSLDIEKMNKAANLLMGEHDFQGFSNKKTKKSTIRTIKSLDIIKEKDELKFYITADGFLYNMVRIIVGTLLEVGEGKIKEDAILNMLESKERENAGTRAPAKGLTLQSVKYN
ncbi:tRNA pseudouridine38-40 synthase [Natranaerovirga hydrolytica]|uniref:tRNA pseudouridine synthase A n=1 Tax=Natranaerovirga hydrolytica TaxID=680378 RepID=A0A4R1MDC0_9FIRM|nr:tRNA pseudouridine(38-40) synthase TruA [Natranaerovirga hydrolytica]TCK89024.1 tRNA pseudouridine38-40 synthase [Natranaerovirga hydrolytica]